MGVERFLHPSPEAIEGVHHRSSRSPLKKGCRTFPSADFARYSISTNTLGPPRRPCVRSACRRLRSADQRLQPLLQVGRRDLVEAVVDLAGIDEVLALAPSEIDAVPPASLSQSRRWSASPVARRSLDPVVHAAPRIGAVADLRHHALETDLVGVREYVFSVDLEAIAELHDSAGDDLLDLGLAADQQLLPDVAAVQLEQVERHQGELVLAAKLTVPPRGTIASAPL